MLQVVLQIAADTSLLATVVMPNSPSHSAGPTPNVEDLG
jgi:hypothetical protein